MLDTTNATNAPCTVVLNGQDAWTGTVAYYKNGWIGVRDADGRIDEVRPEWVRLDG